MHTANPGSLCWLTPNHPIPNDGCEDADAFKYGLESNFPAYASKNAHALGREGIIKRYHSRTPNYAWGLVRVINPPSRIPMTGPLRKMKEMEPSELQRR